MEKYRGISSYVARCGGVPTLFVNGAPFPAAAYMTYLEEYNNYSQFAEAGCRLFSVPVLFAGRWINAAFNNKPFHNGIFDNKNGPDFSALDGSVQKILDSCPDALIFPRLNVSMPLWWIEENVDCLDGMGQRESLYSQKFRDTACDMLRQVIRHINRSAYASHIVGYQIAGGNTEEWFHFDLNAGFSETAEKAFDEYLRKYYPDCGFSGLPDMSLLKGKNTYHRDERLALFLEFASFAAADDICLLCSVAKEETGGNVVVGTFYGYSLEVSSPLYGTHSLKTLLACDAVDFICSPNSYIGTRDPGADWTEMYPADSVRLHGKLCMQECDVRTHLTRPLSECAPEYDENASYTAPIWQPLESRELSVSMLRKTFARQLIKGNGFWWFDMWGGWYNDPVILSDIEKMIDICSSSLFARNRASKAETAVFIDESAYKYYTDCAMRNAAFNQRMELGLSGAPYDIYDLSDFEAVYKNYKCVVFLSSLKTTYMARALELCKKDRVKYISLSAYKTKFSSKELRAFMKECGAHIYISSDDIVYVNESFIAVHSRSEGAKTIDLGGLYSYRELLSDGEMSGMSDTITLYMKKNETRLFSLASENSSIY
ncbi:MAG: hypothetical protein IJS90_01615 [Clostridia bacterium]|nr:hypothetical protein [Clostridia bacterium]